MATVKELKNYCRKHKLKKWSRLSKKDLEKFVNKHKNKQLRKKLKERDARVAKMLGMSRQEIKMLEELRENVIPKTGKILAKKLTYDEKAIMYALDHSGNPLEERDIHWLVRDLGGHYNSWDMQTLIKKKYVKRENDKYSLYGEGLRVALYLTFNWKPKYR